MSSHEHPNVLLVTGASQGIGAAIAKRAAQQGYTVAIHYHQSVSKASQVLEEIRRDGGRGAIFQADLRVESQVVKLFDNVREGLGSISHLVCNAGQSKDIYIREFSSENIHELLDLNFVSTALCCREGVKQMSEGSGGVIVNISSRAAALGGLPGRTLYAAAKGAIDSFTIGLAKEVGPQGIRVVGVRPGPTITATHEKRGGEERLNAIMQGTAIGRPGKPEEIADAVLYLLSPNATFVAGTLIDVSGGR
ncbi:SDR family oxidoreductase [Vibrio sp. S9_S30]|uniref:SDR family NAD(P)-dependent oxidoreductase n=1 Tax=Vibrio sp. S9_S30 TaxID=2720226 RepID=UPI0016818F31|nr:SDR family oxidoreductase [Vibrio sp. S9_S30]MBD1557806.1 SDR family oxidoreductase [Vibrio sp. S9_S30]